MIRNAKLGMKVPKYQKGQYIPIYDPATFKNSIETENNNLNFQPYLETLKELEIDKQQLQKFINAQKVISRAYNPENIN